MAGFKSKHKQLALLREKNILTPPGSGKILMETNYNELIKKYGKIFIDDIKSNTSQKYKKIYKDGVSVQEIYNLMKMDRNLANLLLKEILEIEERVKSIFIYYVCEIKGEFALYNRGAYNNASDQKHVVDNIKYMYNLISWNLDKSFVKSDFSKYGNVPLYVISEFITLGELYKFLNTIDPVVSIKVSKHFNLTVSQLKSFVNLLSKFRNACAHNDVLYCYKFKKAAIAPTSMHSKHNLSTQGNTIYNHNLFACLLVIKHFKANHEYKKIINEVDELFNSLIARCKVLTLDDMFNYSGIPVNYKSLLF